MHRVLRAGRAVVAWAVLTASLATAALVQPTATAAVSYPTYTANTSVNVRAKSGTSATILGQLAEGQTVQAAGKVSGDWLPVKYAGKTGYAWAEYLTADATTPALITTGPAGKKTALENVNVRGDASMTAPISAILPKGTVIRISGQISGDFAQVTVNSQQQWIHSRFLSAATDTTPDVVASYTTTAKLALRASASASAKNQGSIKAGKTLGTTGTHTGSYSQVVYAGKVGWVITGFLKAVAGTPDNLVLPLASGKLLVIATNVPLRASADAESAQTGTLPLAASIRLTGATQNGFTQVIWNGAAGWAASSYLAATMPPGADLGSDSLNKLEPYARVGVLEVRANFPQITTIYGWRASSAYSEDHPSGRATDNMIPSYKTNIALGDAVAEYFIANGDRLHVNYVIWRQRNYRLTRGYWVQMADRGGDTANHMDHVHVSFFDS